MVVFREPAVVFFESGQILEGKSIILHGTVGHTSKRLDETGKLFISKRNYQVGYISWEAVYFKRPQQIWEVSHIKVITKEGKAFIYR